MKPIKSEKLNKFIFVRVSKETKRTLRDIWKKLSDQPYNESLLIRHLIEQEWENISTLRA